MATVGMPESVQVRLRNDRGFPLAIIGVGLIARATLVAATVMPILEAVDFIVRQ
jgi:hypothetical protein